MVLSRAGHTGEAAIFGSAQHKQIEDGDQSRYVVRQVLEGASEIRHEVSYAIDVNMRTVREIGVGLGRDYGALAETEIALTIDVECLRPDGWWVGDWKSRSRVSAVGSNWQVRCAVIAVMSRHRVDAVTGFLGYLDDSELESEPFDAFHVAAWWAELGDLLFRVKQAEIQLKADGSADVNAGTWCQYCPALPYCPAHTRLALSMLGELDGVDSAIASLTVEQCGKAWELLKRYDVIADRVKDTIRSRVRREMVPLSNGRRLALVDCERKSFDQKSAISLLEKHGETVPYKKNAYVQVKEVKVRDV
jgi:hypothetical protein